MTIIVPLALGALALFAMTKQDSGSKLAPLLISFGQSISASTAAASKAADTIAAKYPKTGTVVKNTYAAFTAEVTAQSSKKNLNLSAAAARKFIGDWFVLIGSAKTDSDRAQMIQSLSTQGYPNAAVGFTGIFTTFASEGK